MVVEFPNELEAVLAFADRAGRDHMTVFDGHEANFNPVEDYLRTLQSR
jgi:hypothetical protein